MSMRVPNETNGAASGQHVRRHGYVKRQRWQRSHGTKNKTKPLAVDTYFPKIKQRLHCTLIIFII